MVAIVIDVSKKDIEEIKILLQEKYYFLLDPPAILEKILIAYEGRERSFARENLGTTDISMHTCKYICPKCKGRGWLLDEKKELERIKYEKKALGLEKDEKPQNL